MRRRVRATFGLRCLLLALGLVPFAVAMLVHAPLPVALAAFASAEVGALILEHVLVRAMSRGPKPVVSRWFIDLDLQAARRLATFHEETRDNPTLR